MHTRKKTVGQVIGTIVIALLIMALMIYTATRTVHFLQGTFPPDMGYVAYLALAGFDGGIIGWTFFVSTAAEGPMQRGLSYIMIFVCLLGVVVTTVADTVIVSAQNGKGLVPDYMAAIGVWGSIVIIVLNVVAGVCVHLLSPSHQRRHAIENLHDNIWGTTIQAYKDEIASVTPMLAKESARAWTLETMHEVFNSLPHPELRNTPRLTTGRTIESPRTMEHREQPYGRAALANSVAKVDPHGVKKEVKSNPNKPSPIKDAFNSIIHPTGEKPKKGKIDMSSPEQDYGKAQEPEYIEDEYIEEDTEEMDYMVEGADYHDWSKAEFKEHRDTMDAFEYANKYEEVFGVNPDDDQPPVVKKKKGRPSKKTENLED